MSSPMTSSACCAPCCEWCRTVTHRVVMVIDQLEELFTTTEATSRERFLTALLPVLDDAHERALVITAVRADFYDRVLAHGNSRCGCRQGIVNVVPLLPDGTRAGDAGALEAGHGQRSTAAWWRRSSVTSSDARRRCHCSSTR